MYLGAAQIDFLNSDNILHAQTLLLRGMDDDYGPALEKALKKDKAWQAISSGGMMQCRLIIRCQVAEEGGHLIYNGRRFNRGCWSWRPPKVIRLQGRTAREYPDPINEHPEITIITEKGQLLRLDACPCGGELVKDHRGVLYCEKCSICYE
jgi:hypothetical protein